MRTIYLHVQYNSDEHSAISLKAYTSQRTAIKKAAQFNEIAKKLQLPLRREIKEITLYEYIDD